MTKHYSFETEKSLHCKCSLLQTNTQKPSLLLTLQLWSGSDMYLTDRFQHRHEVWSCCIFRPLLLHPWPAHFPWWLRVAVLHLPPRQSQTWQLLIRFPVRRCLVVFGSRWMSVALTWRPTAVLESFEDHLDVLLSLQLTKGKRLIGHCWHGVILKIYVELTVRPTVILCHRRLWDQRLVLYYGAGFGVSEVTSGLTLGFPSYNSGLLLTGVYCHGNCGAGYVRHKRSTRMKAPPTELGARFVW